MKVDNLFVYGTLMPGQFRYKAIEDQVTVAAKAKVAQAQLYDYMGLYPFMKRTNDSSDEVSGYLLLLNHDNNILEICDAIEGYPYLFDRDFVTARNEFGQNVKALAYFGASEQLFDKGILIKNGVWDDA